MTLTKEQEESNPVLNLECGTSLAELEYSIDAEANSTQQQLDPEGGSATSPSNSTNGGGVNASSLSQIANAVLSGVQGHVQNSSGGNGGENGGGLSTLEQIEQLRESLVHDIVKTSSSSSLPSSSSSSSSSSSPSSNSSTTVSMFTSPFETCYKSNEKKSINTNKTATNSETNHDSHKANKAKQRYAQVPLIYCDQTASNRPLNSIEQYIHNTCLPLYGNTHTNTSITGSQSTAFVAEARQIVAECVNAKITGKASVDTVLFTGNGTTSAVELLIDCLGIQQHQNKTHDNSTTRPVVFIGPYEHHSNLLPWRESGCEIVMIQECTKTCNVNFEQLEQLLREYSTNYPGRLLMGTFTAASNVNGLVTDVNRIAAILHRYGALAFFDYATGASYLPIDMNPSPTTTTTTSDYTQPNINISKDAVYLSPHKMLGGINTPGVLILKKSLVNQINAPHKSGGGTVFYVTHDHHRFLSNRIERFEGGTPNVVGIMRVGLTFLVQRLLSYKYKSLIGAGTTTTNSTTIANQNNRNHVDNEDDDAAAIVKKPTNDIPTSILEYDYSIHHYAVQRLKKNAPNLIMLGCSEETKRDDENVGDMVHTSTNQHLPILSFLVKCGHRFLHYNYVCAILNDLFGIQSRGGCQCSGPYSQRLLGLTIVHTPSNTERPNKTNTQIETALMHYKERAELLRPGYTRLSLPFKGLQHEEVEYVLSALEWVSKNGWALMCQYRCNHRTGEWRHFSRQGKPLGRTERRWLSHYHLGYGEKSSGLSSSNSLVSSQSATTTATSGTSSLDEALKEATVNANYQLENAKKDPVSISQAFKMSNEGVILSGDNGGDDGELEDLRWYVYPKEVAQLLMKDDSTEDFPGTYEDRIVGALRPLGYFAKKDEGSDMDCDDSVVDGPTKLESGTSSEEKINDAKAIEDSSDAINGGGEISLHEVLNNLNKEQMYSFRDGETHDGQAHIDDIIEGYHDEELSEECLIYISEDDQWYKVKELVEASERKVSESSSPTSTHNSVKSTSDSQDISMATDGNSTAKNNTTTSVAKVETVETVKPAPIRDTKREQKKPSRDSSTWGHNQTSVNPTVQPTTNNDSASSEQKEDGPITQSASYAAISEDAISTNSTTTNTTLSNSKRKKQKFLKPPAKLTKYIIQAIVQWDMIKDGDRLLLGLSGGKDSLSLLHCLLEYKRKMPTKFEIEVCTIDPMTPSFDPSPLIPYVKSLGLKYYYIKDDIVTRASNSGKDGKVVTSLCAYCARMKRGLLYQCARVNKCNKLVLAQHLDDCAESLIMSLMHNGFIRTMKANYEINAGDISVIRPMVYCREALMTAFAKEANLPIINENCPACFEEPKERDRVKKLLSREETLYPNLYDNLRRALIPIMHDDSTAILRAYTEEAVSKSRRNKGSNTPNNNNNNKKKKKNDGKRKEPSEEVDANEGENMSTSSMEEKKEEDGINVVSFTEHGVESTAVPLSPSSPQSEKERILSQLTDEELLMEFSRRKAKKFKLSGGYSRNKRAGGEGANGSTATATATGTGTGGSNANEEYNGGLDPTGQVCTLDGRNGTIRCTELME